MSYGLFDADIKQYPYIPFFNLELMKISAYYKKRREIVTLSPTFSPRMYQNFILRQDFPGEDYPIIKYNNIEYGGRAFNLLKYKPLPLEIEKTKPDTFLYNKLESTYAISKNKTSAFRRMRKAEHIRISLDGKTVWSNFESQFRRENKYVGVIFHDYDLGMIDGGYELVIDILKDYKLYQDGKRIGMKFPVQVETAEDLLRWCSIKPMRNFYSIQYNGIMDTKLIDEFLEATAHTSSMIQTYYNISKNVDYNHFITQDIVVLYKQMCFLRTKGVYFSLIYDENFFQDRRWIDVITLINAFWHSTKTLKPEYLKQIQGYDSMYNFVKNLKYYKMSESYFSIQKMREVFQFVRENNYELFKLFYEYKV